ncbi:MAG: bifunctional phosphopantothenoylcysteine decarboxylase/phosphopantothenate--cysteine ligase CoaBC [Labilithrix sp.]|nr:bifunctional phosphopantothenoylcysteine decarboxylase/phosphopantothenate--cysteine ligase CoaBC [Labilithrix sp.]
MTERPRPNESRRRVVALAVTGSIAAYKAVEVARLLVKAGHRVLPLMTASATRFVGPVTLSGICGEPVATDMWDPTYPGELHVALADRADVVAIVPATADVLARLAHGRADDLVAATALCAKGPVLVAPAMHPRMWSHPATRANLAELARQGRVSVVGPVVGPVASGDVGMGRMAEPVEIARAIEELLAGAGDLSGKRVVVTAGPTFEPIDPVRFLGNRSSGKMGFALAARARARGADVVLVAGPVALPTPAGVERRDVETAEQMRAALADALGPDLGGADAVVMAAAVADFRPASASGTKIKKDASSAPPAIALAQNPDLIAEIASKRSGPKPVLVAFALETGDDASVLGYARRKLEQKRVDLVVANAAHESLGHADNRVALVDAAGASPFVAATKDALADRILDRLVTLLG